MTKINQIYKCNICGNVTEVTFSGAGELVCCGQPMELMKAKVEDEDMEKHVPVVEKTNTGIKVTVGSTKHPMEDSHYIAWIQVISGGIIYRKFFKPGEEPVAEFVLNNNNNVLVKAYCNLHGLWSNSKS